MPETRVLLAQNPTKQRVEFGFVRPPLPRHGAAPELDRALAVVREGVSPLVIRDLDAWTGLRHFQYALPSGLPVNANIWTLMSTGEFVWLNDAGVAEAPPAWAPSAPNVFERVFYDFESDPPPPPPVEKPRIGVWMGLNFYASPLDDPALDGETLVFDGATYKKRVVQQFAGFGKASWWEKQ